MAARYVHIKDLLQADEDEVSTLIAQVNMAYPDARRFREKLGLVIEKWKALKAGAGEAAAAVGVSGITPSEVRTCEASEVRATRGGANARARGRARVTVRIGMYVLVLSMVVIYISKLWCVQQLSTVEPHDFNLTWI